MKQIGVRYLWSTLNLLHIAVVLVTVVYYCFRAKFCRPILRWNYSKSSINWFWFCPIFFFSPNSIRPLQTIAIFDKVERWSSRIYFAHLNNINQQLNRNQISNEMTVLKWAIAVVVDCCCRWKITFNFRFLIIIVSGIQCIGINLICLHSKKNLSVTLVRFRLSTLHVWPMSTEHTKYLISWELCHS